MIIAFEGIDGAGKSTACQAVNAKFYGEGTLTETIATRCPWEDEDDDGEEFTSSFPSLSRGAQCRLGRIALALWNCAEFAHSWESTFLIALEAGRIVIADRYKHTALVRDVIRGVDEDFIRAIYAFAPEPDLIIYLDVDPDTAYVRKVELGGEPSYYESGRDLYPIASSQRLAFLAFQKRCRERYNAVLPSERTVRIDASRPVEQVHADVFDTIEKRLNIRSDAVRQDETGAERRARPRKLAEPVGS